jgi:hypothetical protein
MIINNLENWMLPELAFEWIYNNIKFGSTILELGSGYGTEILSKSYKIYSIEQNSDWLDKFDSEYIYAPIEDGFYCKESLKSIPKIYDLLIIDGPTKSSGGRLGIIDNLEYFYLECPILIDDTNRQDELDIANFLSVLTKRKVKTFKCDNKSFSIIK